MSSNYGNLPIDNAFYGDSQVDKLMHGSNLVWAKPTQNLYINYDWSTQVTSGNMELVDIGTSGLNASMFSGEGILFDGVGNNLPTDVMLPANATFAGRIDFSTPYTDWNVIFGNEIWSEGKGFFIGKMDSDFLRLKNAGGGGWDLSSKILMEEHDVIINFNNGVITLYLDGILDKITNVPYLTNAVNPLIFGSRYYSNDGSVTSGAGKNPYNFIAKDFFVFSDVLTQAEITKYSNNPNGFFQNVRDGIIDNCVFNSPMDGTDEYTRDYQNYVKDEKVVNGNFIDSSSWAFTNDASISGGEIIFNSPSGGTDAIAINDGILIAGATYIITINITALTAETNIGIGSNYDGTYNNITYLNPSGVGVLTTEFTATATGKLFLIGGGSAYTNKTSSVSINESTGISQITNYTSSCRDTTSTLPYGSQEMKFKRDGLWRGSLSPYLEPNGIGYANIPTQNVTKDINVVTTPKALSGNILSGAVTLNTTGMAVGTESNVTLSAQAINGAITIGNGYSGTIKTYKEI